MQQMQQMQQAQYNQQQQQLYYQVKKTTRASSFVVIASLFLFNARMSQCPHVSPRACSFRASLSVQLYHGSTHDFRILLATEFQIE